MGLSICRLIGRALEQSVNSFPDKNEAETIKDITHNGWVFIDKDGVAQDQADHDNANPPKDVCHDLTIMLTIRKTSSESPPPLIPHPDGKGGGNHLDVTGLKVEELVEQHKGTFALQIILPHIKPTATIRHRQVGSGRTTAGGVHRE